MLLVQGHALCRTVCILSKLLLACIMHIDLAEVAWAQQIAFCINAQAMVTVMLHTFEHGLT